MGKTICEFRNYAVKYDESKVESFRIVGTCLGDVKGEVVRDGDEIVLVFNGGLKVSRGCEVDECIDIHVQTKDRGLFVLVGCHKDEFDWKHNWHLRNRLKVSYVLHQPMTILHAHDVGSFDVFCNPDKKTLFDKVRFCLGKNVRLEGQLMISGWPRRWRRVLSAVDPKEYYIHNKNYVYKEELPGWHQPDDIVLCEDDDFTLKLICRKPGWVVEYGHVYYMRPEEIYWELELTESLSVQQIEVKLLDIVRFFEFLIGLPLSLDSIHVTSRDHVQEYVIGKYVTSEQVQLLKEDKVGLTDLGVDFLATHYKDGDGELIGTPEGLFPWWNVESVALSCMQKADGKYDINVTSQDNNKLNKYLRRLDFNRGERLSQYLPSFLKKMEEGTSFRRYVSAYIKGYGDIFVTAGLEYLYHNLFPSSEKRCYRQKVECLMSLPEHKFSNDFAEGIKLLRNKRIGHHDVGVKDEDIVWEPDDFFCLIKFCFFQLFHADEDLNSKIAGFKLV